MKKKMVLVCLVFFAFSVFIGCSKDEPTENPDENFSLQAKVDGNLLTINEGILTAIIVNNAGNAGGYLEIAGWAGYGNSQMLFRLRYMNSDFLSKATLKAGKVTDFMLEVVESGNHYKNQKYDLTGLHVTNPNGVPDGQFTIKEISDTHITGSFSFTGYNDSDGSKINVTDGKFNAVFVGDN